MRTIAADTSGAIYTIPTNTISDNNSYLIQIKPINSETIDVPDPYFISESIADSSIEFDIFNDFNTNAILRNNELLNSENIKSNNYSKEFGLGYELVNIRNPTFAPNYPIRIYT